MSFKLALLVVFLGTILCVKSISAQSDSEIKQRVQAFFDSIPKDKIKSYFKAFVDVAKGVLGNLGDIFNRQRSKRSIHTSSYKVTKVDNATNFERVEMSNTWNDKDQEKATCLVKDNEIYWLEFVTGSLIRVMQEMQRVLQGKLVPYKFPKAAYNRTHG